VGLGNGFYGAVMRKGPGTTFVGTGHHEGGDELVDEVRLEVDGAPRPAHHGATYEGERIRLVKRSRIESLHAETTLDVSADGIGEALRLRAPSDQWREAARKAAGARSPQ
jgi:hypothetical protein